MATSNPSSFRYASFSPSMPSDALDENEFLTISTPTHLQALSQHHHQKQELIEEPILSHRHLHDKENIPLSPNISRMKKPTIPSHKRSLSNTETFLQSPIFTSPSKSSLNRTALGLLSSPIKIGIPTPKSEKKLQLTPSKRFTMGSSPRRLNNSHKNDMLRIVDQYNSSPMKQLFLDSSQEFTGTPDNDQERGLSLPTDDLNALARLLALLVAFLTMPIRAIKTKLESAVEDDEEVYEHPISDLTNAWSQTSDVANNNDGSQELIKSLNEKIEVNDRKVQDLESLVQELQTKLEQVTVQRDYLEEKVFIMEAEKQALIEQEKLQSKLNNKAVEEQKTVPEATKEVEGKTVTNTIQMYNVDRQAVGFFIAALPFVIVLVSEFL